MDKSQNQNIFLLFHSHKMHLVALSVLSTDHNDEFSYPFIYSSASEIPTLSCSNILKPEKGTLFGRNLPILAIIGNSPWAHLCSCAQKCS